MSKANLPLALLLILACGDDDVAVDAAAADVVSRDASQADVPSEDAGPMADAARDVPTDGFVSLPVFIYGNTRSELYQLDPRDGTLLVVGAFDCISLAGNVSDSSGGMTDIAVDADGAMFGVGRAADDDRFHTLVSIDPTTGGCRTIAPVEFDGAAGTGVQGLSFVGEGSFTAGEETLVGTNGAGEFFSIDTTSGEATPLGSITASSDIRGGDMVSVRDGATWVITSANTLVTFELASGDVLTELPITGVEGNDSIGWGLGYWGGSVFAFSFNGRLYSIDTETATATEIPIADAPDDLSFRGAAVTTAVTLI